MLNGSKRVTWPKAFEKGKACPSKALSGVDSWDDKAG